MRLTVPRGQPGAVLALAVLCAHGLALQVLGTRSPPPTGLATPPGLRVHTVELARAPETDTTAGRGMPRGANGAVRADSAAISAPIGVTTAAPIATPTATPNVPVGSTPAQTTASSITPVPARIAPPMRLRYAVSGHTRERAVTGQATLTWQHDGQHYEAHLEQDGEGLMRRHQRSAGRVTAMGLAPRRYAERARHEEAVHFEQDGRLAIFSANRPPAPMQDGAQDRLSVLLQLGARIAARPQAYPPGAQLEVQAATTREALIWRFQVEGAEELQLPGGHQATLRLVRRPAGEFEPRLEVWLAPGLDYAPVRLRLTQHNGDHLDYRWSGTDRP